MAREWQFALGGLGGLLPVLASLIAVDLNAIAALIDQHRFTEGLFVGICLRVAGLFLLGGFMAALNPDLKSPLSIVQIGIAAPALVTSWLGAAAVAKPDISPVAFFSMAANAAEVLPIERVGFLTDVARGLTPGLGQPQTRQDVFHLRKPGDAGCLQVAPGSAVASTALPPGYVLEPGPCP